MNQQSNVIYPGVQLGPDVTVGEFSVLGKPARSLREVGQRKTSGKLPRSTMIGQGTEVGSFVLIEEGATIGRECAIEARAVVETRAVVGDRCFIVHGARLCADCTVGEGSVIGGFVAERAVVGKQSRVFGMLIHRQLDPTMPWDETFEDAPVLDSDVFVGMGAIIVGPARLGTHVYVVAGAIVTKDIPPFSIVHGTNCIVAPEEWKGRLPKSMFWKRDV